MKPNACSPASVPRLLVSVPAPDRQACKLPLHFRRQLRKGRPRGRRLRMNHDIERGKLRLIGPSTVNLSQSALDPVPDHGPANLASNGDSESRAGKLICQDVDRRIRSVPSAPTLVTSSVIFPSPNSALRRRKPGRARYFPPARHSIYADTRERPFRRRRERIARP